MHRVLLWLAAGLLVTCVTLAVLILRLRDEVERSRSEMADYRSAEKKDQREIAELRRKLAARASPSREGNQAEASADAVNSMDDFEKAHPEWAAMRRREVRRDVLRRYGNAFASLNLPPEKLAALKSLLAELQLSSSDAVDAAQAAGIGPGTPAFGRVMQQTFTDLQKSIETLVGAEGWGKLQQAAKLSAHQTQVQESYAPDFEDAGVPVTADQQQALAQLMSAGPTRAASPAGFFQPDPKTWLSPSDEAMLVQAAEILSPAQVAVLKGDLADQHQESAKTEQDMPDGTITIDGVDSVEVETAVFVAPASGR